MCVKSKRCIPKTYVRISHCMIVLGVASVIVFRDTDIHRALWSGSVDILRGVGFLFLVSASLVLYLITCLVSPGYAPVSKHNTWKDDSDEECENKNVSDEEADMLPQTPSKAKLRKCGFCMLKQPLRCRHCEDCGRCVLKFDHHCPWLETCIGEQNHRYFLLFIMTTLAIIVWSSHIIWHAYVFQLPWKEWFSTNILYLICMLILLCGGFPVVVLCGLHTYLAFTNQSTWELMARHRITYLKYLDSDKNPFHEGYICNMWRFLCHCRQRRWDVLYNKKVPEDESEV